MTTKRTNVELIIGLRGWLYGLCANSEVDVQIPLENLKVLEKQVEVDEIDDITDKVIESLTRKMRR